MIRHSFAKGNNGLDSGVSTSQVRPTRLVENCRGRSSVVRVSSTPSGQCLTREFAGSSMISYGPDAPVQRTWRACGGDSAVEAGEERGHSGTQLPGSRGPG